MNIQLIAIDMDGTLVNSSHQIDARTMAAVKAAVHKGMIVVPTTGRPYASVPAELLSISEIRYVITSNGADVLDQSTHRSICTRFLSAEEALHITQRLSRHNLYMYIHSAGNHYELKDSVSPFAKLHPDAASKFPCFQVDDFSEFISTHQDSIEKVGGICYDAATYNQILEEEKKLGNVNMASTGELSLEFNSPDASKGNALAFLCEKLGISPEHVMVLGDNQNDISMFRFANYSVAMGNAIAELKSIASEITQSCDNFGAAIAIERVLDCRHA